nr:uncharacterized protein LOC111426595 [Onthophagus taurus]
MFQKILTVSIFLTIFGSTLANVKTCYECKSKSDPKCDDPFDSSKFNGIECSTLMYSQSSNDPHSFIRFAENHERADDGVKYACIKYSLKPGTAANIIDEGIGRTCFKLSNNIEDPCEFLQKESEYNGTYALKTCNYCLTDDCNSGVLHKASAILLGIILFVITL